MLSEVKFKVDGGTLTRSADGKVTVGGKAGCLTWVLIVSIGLVTIGAAVWMLISIVKMILQFSPDLLKAVLGLFSLTIILGSATIYLFVRSRRGKVTIDPASRMLTVGKRTIPFSEVETVMSTEAELPMMNGAIMVSFFAVLKRGEKVGLANISGSKKKLDESVAQIQTILGVFTSPA